MDGSKVEPDFDMKTQQVNDMKLEGLIVSVRHSSLNDEEHNGTVVKREPDSDGEMEPQLSHHRDQIPAPFSFVAVKSEIVHEDESWDSTTVKEELKDVISTEDYEECLDREEKLWSQESSSYGSLSAEVNGHEHCYGVSAMSNCCDADRCNHNEINVRTTTGVMLGNVNSIKVRRKRRNNTGEKTYKCDECNRMFARKEHLMRHYRTHTGERPYKCDICNKLFSQNGTLKSHYRTHTGEKPYSCSVCNRRFAENANLRNHFRIHTEERRYKCDLCSKAFSMRVSLKTHYRSHMGGKTHNCEICRKEFSKGDNLRKHYRTHTGEKPHKCDQCGKEFSVSANLKRHIRTHTGEKPYKCELCNKEYSKSEHLKAHQRIHTVV